MKPRKVLVTIELETVKTVKELKDLYRNYVPEDSVVCQVQTNLVVAPAKKK